MLDIDSRKVVVTSLGACERIIEDGLRLMESSTRRIGEALKVILQQRLYRQANYRSFEAYIKERWSLSRPRGNQLINASTIITNIADHLALPAPVAAELSTTVDNPSREVMEYPLPEREQQVRPLVSLPPEEQAAVWREAVETAPDGSPTGRFVAEVVSRRKLAKERREALQRPLEGDPDITLHCCRFQDSPVGEASVDWIITDAPYGVAHLELYRDLSAWADLVLKPGGSALVDDRG